MLYLMDLGFATMLSWNNLNIPGKAYTAWKHMQHMIIYSPYVPNSNSAQALRVVLYIIIIYMIEAQQDSQIMKI